MRRRSTYTLLAVLLLVCALAAVLYLRQKAPPEAARLLPESDAIVFLNLKPIRAVTHFDRNPFTPASFQPFIDATGILPERDLDSVAFALHRMPNPNGPNGPVGYTEVFEGRFDTARLATYLAAQSAKQETYANHIIYSIPSAEGRAVLVAVLGYDLIAASNMPTPEQIHSILDRQRAAASPFAGSSLLNALYADVPAFSPAWAVGQIGLPFAKDRRIAAFDFELPLPADANFVASLRFTTALHLRIDALTDDPESAVRAARELNNLLNLARTVGRISQPDPATPSEQATRQFTDSIAIEPHKDRTTLTATIPAEALKSLSLPNR